MKKRMKYPKTLAAILSMAMLATTAPMTVAAETKTDTTPAWERVSGDTRYTTSVAAAKKELAVQNLEKFDCAVIASGRNYPDALTGCTLASQKNAPMLLVKPDNTNEAIQSLKEMVTDGSTVYVLGGDAAIPSSTDTKLTNAGYTVKRLAGSSRYNTNLSILDETATENILLVASGKNYADALSASATGKPLMIVGDVLSDAQADYLASRSFDNIYILGGSDAVSTSVEHAIDAATGKSTSRIAGANRYSTSRLVAERFSINADTAVIAYARNYPDGLSAGPLAHLVNAPILLAANGSDNEAKTFIKNNGEITKGIVMGGTDVISDKTANNVFSVLKTEITDPSEPTDPENPGEGGDGSESGSTDPENPGSGDGSESGSTDPENPGGGDGSESGSTDPENPGESGSTDPENPGEGGGDSGSTDPSEPTDPETPEEGTYEAAFKAYCDAAYAMIDMANELGHPALWTTYYEFQEQDRTANEAGSAWGAESTKREELKTQLADAKDALESATLNVDNAKKLIPVGEAQLLNFKNAVDEAQTAYDNAVATNGADSADAQEKLQALNTAKTKYDNLAAFMEEQKAQLTELEATQAECQATVDDLTKQVETATTNAKNYMAICDQANIDKQAAYEAYSKEAYQSGIDYEDVTKFASELGSAYRTARYELLQFCEGVPVKQLPEIPSRR